MRLKPMVSCNKRSEIVSKQKLRLHAAEAGGVFYQVLGIGAVSPLAQAACVVNSRSMSASENKIQSSVVSCELYVVTDAVRFSFQIVGWNAEIQLTTDN
jgi:hypothetical protein